MLDDSSSGCAWTAISVSFSAIPQACPIRHVPVHWAGPAQRPQARTQGSREPGVHRCGYLYPGTVTCGKGYFGRCRGGGGAAQSVW